MGNPDYQKKKKKKKKKKNRKTQKLQKILNPIVIFTFHKNKYNLTTKGIWNLDSAPQKTYNLISILHLPFLCVTVSSRFSGWSGFSILVWFFFGINLPIMLFPIQKSRLPMLTPIVVYYYYIRYFRITGVFQWWPAKSDLRFEL